MSGPGLRLLLVSGIFPPDIGGPATYVPHIAAALVKCGHRITVVTLSDRLEHDDAAYPFRVVRLPRRLRKLRRWWQTVATIRRLGRNADVLFVQGLALEAVLANFVLRKPLVHKVVGDVAWERATNHGWVQDSFEDFQQTRFGPKIEFLKALRTWWLRRADTVMVPSRYLARWVATWGVPAEKLVVVYNALACLDDIQPAAVPLATRLKVVTAGRLVAWKRVDRVIAAVAQLPEEVGLVVVGDGPERAHLEGVAQALGIADRVHFAGQRSKSETLSLLAAGDLFVLNSTYEGLPHVVLEALALGVPVIATAVGGTPEVVADRINGRLVAPTDDGALTAALRELVASPGERRRLAARARQTAARFAMPRMVEATEAVLRQCSAPTSW